MFGGVGLVELRFQAGPSSLVLPRHRSPARARFAASRWRRLVSSTMNVLRSSQSAGSTPLNAGYLEPGLGRSLELSGASSVDFVVHAPVMTRQRPLVAVKLADFAGALNSAGREPVGHRTTRNWQPHCS